MIMHFGKHKGEEVIDLPIDYLEWLVENCEDDEIRTEAEEICAEHKDNNPHF